MSRDWVLEESERMVALVLGPKGLRVKRTKRGIELPSFDGPSKVRRFAEGKKAYFLVPSKNLKSSAFREALQPWIFVIWTKDAQVGGQDYHWVSFSQLVEDLYDPRLNGTKLSIQLELAQVLAKSAPVDGVNTVLQVDDERVVGGRVHWGLSRARQRRPVFA